MRCDIINIVAVHDLINWSYTIMPLPKVPNGLKLTLMLPGDVVLRVKTEAVQERTQPSTVVQRALAAYWGMTAIETPTWAPVALRSGAPLGLRLTTRQKQALRGRSLYALLQESLAMKLFAEDQLLKALGITRSAFIRYWQPDGKVPVNKLKQVHAFLDNYTMIEGALKDALRVPDFI
jgi:hypothetical protein